MMPLSSNVAIGQRAAAWTQATFSKINEYFSFAKQLTMPLNIVKLCKKTKAG
ncbi:hypothetical protein [Sphingorhabdus profundilacus]|uniref:hypothetical protein n=1 Tax=Sphingorhabdus profundilacus TaxID=2509718 RepID=UPI00136521EA|nr:hypothetical protein [Sphingorhabdus profundilacus]